MDCRPIARGHWFGGETKDAFYTSEYEIQYTERDTVRQHVRIISYSSLNWINAVSIEQFLIFIFVDLNKNRLGKSNRMEVLAKSGLNAHDENTILEYCCDLSASPYNRRTRKPLSEILQFVYRLENCNHHVFDENGRFAYRWWWAFCKKYSIVSLHYDNNANIKMTERNWFSSRSIRFTFYILMMKTTTTTMTKTT